MNELVLEEHRQERYLETLSHYAEMADRRSIEMEDEIHLCRMMKTLSLIPRKDGNQWCVLYGANLQEGIAGFGDTPISAMRAFRRELVQG